MVFSSAGMGLASASLAIPETFFQSAQPSLIGRPLLEASTLFSLILLTALALEWAWRMAWALYERPARLKDPSASIRWTILLLLTSVLLRMVPDTILGMSWAEIRPGARYSLALLDRQLDALSIIPFLSAWAIAYLGGPMVIYQLRREPLPIHLWPTWRQVQRPLKIAIACLALAIALTYLR